MKKIITFRIPIDLLKQLKRAAKEEGVTVTEIILRAIRGIV